MSKVFLDLGTHYGQGLREFIERFNINDSWRVYTFEANPITFEKYKKEFAHQTPYVESCNAAVSDHFGTITLNIETPPDEDATGQGSSIVPIDNWDPWGNRSSGTHFHLQREVPCFDFSRFISDNFSKDDEIVVKMDIEGSEFDVLEKMILDGTIEYINHISVEWHARFFTNKEETELREKLLIEKLNSYSGLVLESWR
jgi:FkbM family methyltransferase